MVFFLKCLVKDIVLLYWFFNLIFGIVNFGNNGLICLVDLVILVVVVVIIWFDSINNVLMSRDLNMGFFGYFF